MSDREPSKSQLVLLRAVAEGKHFFGELNRAYKDAGYGLYQDWSIMNGLVVKKPVNRPEYHMACQVQLQRLTGCYRGYPTSQPLLRRKKMRGPTGRLQWYYYLTKKGESHVS